jgi:ABC-type polysaccharide/polyol phosphate transport system ATPase subunit
MADVVIEVDHVWKKFRKGELHDSLRDLVPAMTRALLRRARGHGELRQREFWALRNVSFQVERGESLGVIGPNGAGKSTLLKVLTKVLRPNRGTCRVRGRVSALIEVGAGFHPDLTGRENLMLSGAILGMTRQEIRAKEERIIEFAGVREFIDTPVKRYSSGMTARLGFAIAAHMEPDVLLVDEVLSVGDARFRDKCIRHMQKLIRSEVTVIFISHILDQVQALCPNTVVLQRGELAFKGPTQEAVRAYLAALTADDNSPDFDAASEMPGPAEVRHIHLCDAEGQEVLDWQALQPAGVAMEVFLRQPTARLYAVISFQTVNGVFLGSASSLRQGFTVPGHVGLHQMRFILDPNPLAGGDYLVQVKLYAQDPQHDDADPICIWHNRQPRPLSVRGDRTSGALIRCQGVWHTSSQPTTELPV